MRCATFIIDFPVMVIFGALFALLERRDRGGSALGRSSFWHGVVFTSIFNGAVLYAIIYYPDWMWMYFIESKPLSVHELIYIFVFVYYVPYAGGYYIARDLYRKSVVFWVAFVALMIFAEIWIVMQLFDRYSVVGTTEQFHSGTAALLFGPDNPMALPMNFSVGGMIAYYIFVIWLARKKRRRTITL